MPTPLAHDPSRSPPRSPTMYALIQPLLKALEAVTGLECTFLARFDGAQNRLVAHSVHNSRADGVVIREGASAAWNQTLCKGAFGDGVPYTAEADRLWTHSPAATALGVRTYLSQPVRDSHGVLLGTLCGASRRRVPMAEDTLPVARLFAELIRNRLEHERALAEAAERQDAGNVQSVRDALHDVVNPRNLASLLKGVPTRRVLLDAPDGTAQMAEPRLS